MLSLKWDWFFSEEIIHLVTERMVFQTGMEEVGLHIFFISNPFRLPLSTCAAPYFVAHIFQKNLQRQVAETTQT